MKPAIPDAGRVIKLESEDAVVRMKHEVSCRKCGAAAHGMCTAGFTQVLTARNSMRVRVGDTVKRGPVRAVQYQGYVLAPVVLPRVISKA